MIRVAIQGIKGCFHEIAAFKYFGERERIEPVECHSFSEMFEKLELNNDLFAIMAIENTVAGSIIPNYAHLRNSDFKIIGEVYLRIEQCLLGYNGTDLGSLTEVHSHPMALLQCEDFFKNHPHIQLIESPDTALSAKLLSEAPNKNRGAIASFLAAEYYNLEVIEKGVETNKRNFTRFLVLQNQKYVETDPHFCNKATVCFKVLHEAGSLARVLTKLAENQINLTKIQSLPVVGREWEYFFHCDLEFKKYEHYQKALEDLKDLTNEFQILGEYKTGNKIRTL